MLILYTILYTIGTILYTINYIIITKNSLMQTDASWTAKTCMVRVVAFET